jgi:hypothetical protein
MSEQTINQQQQNSSLEDKLIQLREEWENEIATMNEEMKTLPKLNDLINVIYTKRQKLVDLYYGTMGVLKKQVRLYTVKYAELYNQLKMNAQIRYTETALANQIEAQLMPLKEVIENLKTFTEFVYETMKTLDNMIYGVNNKIKIYELMNGLNG